VAHRTNERLGEGQKRRTHETGWDLMSQQIVQT
jgi:hypothetical protein